MKFRFKIFRVQFIIQLLNKNNSIGWLRHTGITILTPTMLHLSKVKKMKEMKRNDNNN